MKPGNGQRPGRGARRRRRGRMVRQGPPCPGCGHTPGTGPDGGHEAQLPLHGRPEFDMSVVGRCYDALAALLGQPEDDRTPAVVLMLWACPSSVPATRPDRSPHDGHPGHEDAHGPRMRNK